MLGLNFLKTVSLTVSPEIIAPLASVTDPVRLPATEDPCWPCAFEKVRLKQTTDKNRTRKNNLIIDLRGFHVCDAGPGKGTVIARIDKDRHSGTGNLSTKQSPLPSG